MLSRPVHGRENIGHLGRDEFAAASGMPCITIQIIEEGNWAVLEWRNPPVFRVADFLG